MKSARPALGVFAILWGSYAFFWHARDWNISSRLMLVYALGDRGQVAIDGLEDHTYDRAKFRGHYYSDKTPGFSLLALPVYLAAKTALHLPPHPIDRRGAGFTHWRPDYIITLGTSGLLTALTGALLTLMAADLGCGPRRSALVGLAYGLSTPAYVYATLSYGHQATAFFALASFASLRWAAKGRKSRLLGGLAGLFAASASVVELQAAPVSALLGCALLRGIISRRIPASALLTFALGALIPSLVLLAYNRVAFGSPFDMGYFHEELTEFSEVHSARNPLGLGRIGWTRAKGLLWGEYRGLLFYAPITALALPGWIVLARRRAWGDLLFTLAACMVIFVVNLSYPNWNGGFSTGPRLLVTLLPFALLASSAFLSLNGRGITAVAIVLALLGGGVMLLFQGVGGRIPPAPEPARGRSIAESPLREIVWPLWRGDPVPRWREGVRFDRNLVSWRRTKGGDVLPPEWQWAQFVPLVVAQFGAIGVMMHALRPKAK